MLSSHRFVTATLITLLLATYTTVTPAAEVGSTTVTNAQHFGRRGLAGNTVTNVVPAVGSTIQAISVTGSLTSVNANTWAKFLRIQPNGAALGSGTGSPGGQGYFAFSGLTNFTTTPVSTLILAPGGFSGSSSLRLEAYTPDSEAATPGLDGTSTLTYSFQDALPNGGANFAGALAAGTPTFTRFANFNADSFGNPVLGVGAATAYYHVQPFSVSVSGTYAMGVAANFDTYIGLYATAFSPTSVLTNLLTANDEGINVLRNASFGSADVDNDSNKISRMDWPLVAGTQYYFVTTSYGSLTTGQFAAQIAGPGAVTLTAVPEPASFLPLTLPVFALLRRKR